MPGNLAHAILNIEENISVTENYFLIDSLEDWVHGMMAGDKLMDDESNGKDEERFWKAMYFKHLETEDRNAVRAMMDQMEQMATDNTALCEDKDQDSEDHDHEDEDEDENVEEDTVEDDGKK